MGNTGVAREELRLALVDPNVVSGGGLEKLE